MHILLVCTARGIPLYGPSGASAHLRGLTWALAARGHRVTIVVGTAGPLRGHPPVPAEVRTLPTPTWPPQRRRRERAEEQHAAALMKLAPEGVDLIWHRHALHDRAVAEWAVRRGVPRWLEVNAPLTLERQLLDPLSRPARAHRMEARSVRTADRVFVVSRWLRPWAEALGARRVQWLPNGTHLPPPPKVRRPNAQHPVIGFMGSCRPWHRPERLCSLLDALPEATACLVGEGPAMPSHPRLHRVGFVSQPQRLAHALRKTRIIDQLAQAFACKLEVPRPVVGPAVSLRPAFFLPGPSWQRGERPLQYVH